MYQSSLPKSALLPQQMLLLAMPPELEPEKVMEKVLGKEYLELSEPEKKQNCRSIRRASPPSTKKLVLLNYSLKVRNGRTPRKSKGNCLNYLRTIRSPNFHRNNWRHRQHFCLENNFRKDYNFLCQRNQKELFC